MDVTSNLSKGKTTIHSLARRTNHIQNELRGYCTPIFLLFVSFLSSIHSLLQSHLFVSFSLVEDCANSAKFSCLL